MFQKVEWWRWRADFQSGSRVLKKVFWTFSCPRALSCYPTMSTRAGFWNILQFSNFFMYLLHITVSCSGIWSTSCYPRIFTHVCCARVFHFRIIATGCGLPNSAAPRNSTTPPFEKFLSVCRKPGRNCPCIHHRYKARALVTLTMFPRATLWNSLQIYKFEIHCLSK